MSQGVSFILGFNSSIPSSFSHQAEGLSRMDSFFISVEIYIPENSSMVPYGPTGTATSWELCFITLLGEKKNPCVCECKYKI